MPETTYRISELTAIDTINNGDLVEVSTVDLNSESGYASRKASMTDLGNKLLNGIEYSTELVTDDKRVIGAINEIAQGGGGSVDITTKIDTPASIQTFNDGGDDIPMKSLIAEIKAIQAGTGTPSPTNVRAISGFSSVKVERVSKNLIHNLYQSNVNQIIVNGNSFYDSALKKGTYTISLTTTKAISFNYKIDVATPATTVFYSSTAGNVSGTFTIDEDLSNVSLYFYNSNGLSISDISNVQLEMNSPATSYEEPKGIRVKTELGRTVYGGYLDVISGELTITHVLFTYDGSSDESWSKVSGTGKFYIVNTDMPNYVETGKISNVYPFSGESSAGSSGVTVDKSFYTQTVANTPAYNRVWIYNSDYEEYTNTQFKEVLSNQPIDILVELVTPITVQLIPNQVATLAGLNNVYADSGDILEIEYFNENANDIDSLVDLEVRLSGRIKTKTYTGDGSVPLVVTFDEVPTMILNIFGNGQNSQVITFPFVYGLTSFGGVYVTPNPWTPPAQSGGGHLLYKVAYSNDGKTMTVRASANDAGAHFNQSGDTYTIYYLV